ncbi:MAG: phage portal protein [Candidatus Omnitrophica bacterium]|nr:phage portal protein [Candidatus Omnitrophota bacterium]
MDLGELKLAYETIRGKEHHHHIRWDYYEGRQPIRWSVEKIQNVFQDLVAFIENWCAVVIDSTCDRLILESLNVVQNDALINRVSELLQDTGLLLEAVDIHREAAIVGESYVIAWKDQEIQAYRNDARTTHLFYEADNPRNPWYGVKLFTADDETARMVLYFADRLEYYRSRKKLDEMGETFSSGEWEADTDVSHEGILANPFGQVPVFRFTIDGRGSSDLDNAIPIQDIINKTLSDIVVIGEYAAFPQRWAVTNNKFPGKLPVTPQTTILLTPNDDHNSEPTQIGTFPAADMKNLLSVKDNMSHSMAIITRTPKHYVFGMGGDPSGEALIASEAPLVKKVLRFQARLSDTWSKLGAFLLKLDGKEVKPTEVKPTWAHAGSILPLSQATIHKTNKDAGIPIITQLRDEGWSEDEIQQMLEDKALEGSDGGTKAGPGASPEEVNAAADRTAGNLEGMAAEAMQAVADGAMDVLAKSGALERIAKRAAQ